jgi:hypothetical protein
MLLADEPELEASKRQGRPVSQQQARPATRAWRHL